MATQLIGGVTLSLGNRGNQLGGLGRICTQEHSKDRSDPGRTLDLEKSAMVVEDVLDDRQAEPGAPHLPGARGVDPVESFGQPRQVLARYALALIAYGYADHCVLGAT